MITEETEANGNELTRGEHWRDDVSNTSLAGGGER
jgi:hypothetical protein